MYSFVTTLNMKSLKTGAWDLYVTDDVDGVTYVAESESIPELAVAFDDDYDMSLSYDIDSKKMTDILREHRITKEMLERDLQDLHVVIKSMGLETFDYDNAIVQAINDSGINGLSAVYYDGGNIRLISGGRCIGGLFIYDYQNGGGKIEVTLLEGGFKKIEKTGDPSVDSENVISTIEGLLEPSAE